MIQVFNDDNKLQKFKIKIEIVRSKAVKLLAVLYSHFAQSNALNQLSH